MQIRIWLSRLTFITTLISISACSMFSSLEKSSDNYLHSGVYLNLPEIKGDKHRLTELLSFPYLKKYIDEHKSEIEEELVKGEYKKIEAQLKSPAACSVVLSLLNDLKQAALYQLEPGGQCLPVSSDIPWSSGLSQNYFTDTQCTIPLNFTPIKKQTYCDELLGTTAQPTLGDANLWTPTSEVGGLDASDWAFPYGSRLHITLISKKQNQQPLMRRLKYKSVNGCGLEMRVYSRNPNLQGQKPMLAIHGGSWKYRRLGFSALESEISMFTQRGYMVFTPFYRLSGDHDGPQACRNATWQQIISDVQDAFDWVDQNAYLLGAHQGEKITLFGQSAGGHLSSWLLTYNQSRVEKGLIFYPPTDLKRFVDQVEHDPAYAKFKERISIVEGFLNKMETTPAQYQQALEQNSFPQHITSSSPPVFLVHGDEDTVVPADQSQQLCNAYNPGDQTIDLEPSSFINRLYATRFQCGGSELNRLDKAEHMFDLICLPDISCAAGNLCAVMGAEEVMKRGYDWLND